MAQNMLVTQGFLPKKAIKLGRFLVDVKQPLNSFHDPEVEINDEDLFVSEHLKYSGEQQASSNNSIAATLTSLASASCSKITGASSKVNADRVTTYQLANSGSLFKKAVKNQGTREWIEEQNRDNNWQNLFFVVGYHTMSDASVLVGGDEKKDVSGQVEVPISKALTAGGIVIPNGGLTDPTIAGTYKEVRGATAQFVAPGERIWALQFRKVVFKWFYSRDIDKATLDRENRWQTLSPLSPSRGKQVKAPEDVLEVNLVDDGDAGGGKGVLVSELNEEFLFPI